VSWRRTIARSKKQKGKIILVGGGARSGKSRFAMDYARTLGERAQDAQFAGAQRCL